MVAVAVEMASVVPPLVVAVARTVVVMIQEKEVSLLLVAMVGMVMVTKGWWGW